MLPIAETLGGCMKVIIVGCGTDGWKIPSIPNRVSPGVLAELEGVRFLFDCSEAVRFSLTEGGGSC